MLTAIAISSLVVGATIGICFYRFSQNGWIPRKYLEEEKITKNPSRTAKYTAYTFATRFYPRKTGKRIYKAAALKMTPGTYRRLAAV